MNTGKLLITMGLAVATLIMLPAARADDYDQAIKLSVDKSVQVPGHVLPAGTYWFVVPIQGVVQIFNQDRSTCYATLLTMAAEHVKPSDETQITFAERGTMQPEAIVTWFYPGRTDGHEFRYPNQDQKEIAQAKQYTVAVGKEIAQAKQRTVAAGE